MIGGATGDLSEFFVFNFTCKVFLQYNGSLRLVVQSNSSLISPFSFSFYQHIKDNSSLFLHENERTWTYIAKGSTCNLAQMPHTSDKMVSFTYSSGSYNPPTGICRSQSSAVPVAVVAALLSGLITICSYLSI